MNTASPTSVADELGTLQARIQIAHDQLRGELAEWKGEDSHWTGKLSDSALSTATAISALAIAKRESSDGQNRSRWESLVERGSAWLARAQNIDGGFGDTDRSLSNIATTLLVIAAWKLAGHEERYADAMQRAENYVDRLGRWEGLRKRYGKDKTFVVPIMTNCALAGMVEWNAIPTLPFEAAALPQSWYRFAKLPVVSYAVPALVAIGQAQWVHNPPRNPITYAIRRGARRRTLDVLKRMQPESGGYLEATPLTSFVLMNLASIGLVEHPVCQDALRFLSDSVTEDGCWPIDTNLATWVTSLTARSYYPCEKASAPEQAEWERTIDWLLSCQHRKRHPFTGAEPGGWGWTDLSGSVPDSDDTPAALLTLFHYASFASAHHSVLDSTQRTRLEEIRRAAVEGCEWLLRLQNRDGGWPTFCRGWGTLPFDRSGSDLTAHALRALHAWSPQLPAPFRSRLDRAFKAGWRYLEKSQHPDGSWTPLWFGNQDREEEDNPIYGTARVLMAYGECGRHKDPRAERGVSFLWKHQNPDGSWGGGPSIQYRPPGEATKSQPDALAREELRVLAPQSLANASGCDGGTLRVPPTDWSDQPGADLDQGEKAPSGTMEETAVALEGIITCCGQGHGIDSIMKGLTWVCDGIDRNYHHTSQPIGFYFAKLWYHEKQYPLAFALYALRKGLEFCQR